MGRNTNRIQHLVKYIQNIMREIQWLGRNMFFLEHSIPPKMEKNKKISAIELAIVHRMKPIVTINPPKTWVTRIPHLWIEMLARGPVTDKKNLLEFEQSLTITIVLMRPIISVRANWRWSNELTSCVLYRLR